MDKESGSNWNGHGLLQWLFEPPGPFAITVELTCHHAAPFDDQLILTRLCCYDCGWVHESCISISIYMVNFTLPHRVIGLSSLISIFTLLGCKSSQA